MKKLGLFLIILLMGATVFAQSTNASLFVGTWRGVDKDGDALTYTFNTDGTIVVSGYFRGNGNYFLSSSKLIYHHGGNAIVSDFYFTSNNRVLVIDTHLGLIWFQKQ